VKAVAIVLEPDYSARLRDLAFTVPVWLIETPANRRAADEVWMHAQDWPQLSVTIISDLPPSMRKEDWRRLLDQIELRHGPAAQRFPFDALLLIGTEMTPSLRAALNDTGFGAVEKTADGFRAAKPRPPAP
jgi:hypothetical protein